MGILDAPAIDWRSNPLVKFNLLRDIPQVVGWWKFDKQLAGVADGTAVPAAFDYSGLQQDLPAVSTAPTKQTDADGKPVVRFAAGQSFYSTSFGNAFPVSKGYPRPVTLALLVKPSAGMAGFPTVMGGNTSNRVNLTCDSVSGTMYGFDGTNGFAGQGVIDGNWHVVVSVIDSGSINTYIDGFLVGGYTGSASATALLGMTMGAASDGTLQFLGDVREAVVSSGRLSFDQIGALTSYLASQVTMTQPTFRATASMNFVDTTSSNGQSIRVWKPTRPSATPVLVLWSHPQGQNQQITPTYWGFPYQHAVNARGGYFAASNMHGVDSWGNSNALADLLDLYNYMSGIQSFSKVVLVGASMGAAASALAVAKATLPAGKVKACYFIDGALSLSAMYAGGTYISSINTGYGVTAGTLSSAMGSTGLTSVPTTASFPTIGTQLILGADTANSEIVTTTGASTGTAVAVTATTKTHASGDKVSDYPTKTAGSDPLLRAATDYAGMPMRFTASTGDVTVAKASNTDPFRTLVTGQASELALVTHTGAHLSGATLISDFDAYVDRVVGW